MKFLIGIVLILTTFNLVAQNLVSNPSFESYTGCPERNGDIKKCVSWSTTSPGSTPDYFHKCFPKNRTDNLALGVPKNSEGYRLPVTGDAYMGLALFFKKNYSTREYIQNRLQEPLKKGVKYKISFYICLSDSSEYTSSHIGVNFSVMPNGIMASAPEPLLTARHLITIKNSEALKSKTWTKVEAEYFAQGDEEYLIIGSFRANMNYKDYKKRLRTEVQNCKDNECAAYYFIDDVYVEVAPNERANPRFR